MNASLNYGFGETAPAQDENRFQQAIRVMNDLFATQKKVDVAIEKMPPGPDQERLKKARDANRGFFSSYVLPAWEKIKSYVSGETSTAPGISGEFDFGEAYFGTSDEALGILPLIPIAAILAAGAVITYATTNYLAEKKILEDPALSASQKTQLLGQRGLTSALTGISSNLNQILLLAGLGIGGYLLFTILQAKKRVS
jgi:hypothetical protein